MQHFCNVANHNIVLAMMRLLFVLSILCISRVTAFIKVSSSFLSKIKSDALIGSEKTSLFAKKAKSSTSGKGFKKITTEEVVQQNKTAIIESDINRNENTIEIQKSVLDLYEEERLRKKKEKKYKNVEELFADMDGNDKRKQTPSLETSEPGFGENVLKMFSDDVIVKFDSFLLASTFISLAVVVSSGIGNTDFE